MALCSYQGIPSKVRILNYIQLSSFVPTRMSFIWETFWKSIVVTVSKNYYQSLSLTARETDHWDLNVSLYGSRYQHYQKIIQNSEKAISKTKKKVLFTRLFSCFCSHIWEWMMEGGFFLLLSIVNECSS